MIYGLVSSFREGVLLDNAVRSAAVGCDQVLICEGPVNNAPATGPESWVGAGGLSQNVTMRYGEWESDAAKRTDLLRWAQDLNALRCWGPAWALWVDGDEALIWPEYLSDLTARAEYETGAGGFGIRIVEMDGSVAMCSGKIIRLDAVERYLVSSYQVELAGGMVVALPNVPICGAGGIPLGDYDPSMPSEERDAWLAKHRPPLQGEPHLLHRSGLRAPTRTTERLHKAEGDWFTNTLEQEGLHGV